MRGAIAKAFHDILSSSSKIARVPSVTENICQVASTSIPRKPHIVDATAKNGKVTCDCTSFKTLSICAHALAGAKFCGAFEKFAEFHNSHTTSAPQLGAVVAHGIDNTIGKKKIKRAERRLGTSKPNPPIRSIATKSGMLSAVKVTTCANPRKKATDPEPYAFELHFLGNVYFHLRLDCIKKKVSDFQPKELIIASDMVLTLQHKRHLRAAMNCDFVLS